MALLNSIRKRLQAHKQAVIFLFLPWTIFFGVLWSQMLVYKSDGLYAGHPFVWADWSLHVGLASSFVHKPIAEWFTNHLLYAGVPLNYPFVTNLISALLMKAGVPLTLSFTVPSFLFSLLLLVSLYIFFSSLTKSVWARVLASNIFLLSGGVGIFIYTFKNPSIEALKDSAITVTQIPDLGIEFTNVLLGMLVPQRAFLLGMPLGLLVLSVLHRLYRKTTITQSTLLLAGTIAGLLPIIHTHTFLVVVMLSFLLFIASVKHIKTWMWYGVPAVIVSLLIYSLFLAGTVKSSSFITYHPGWYVQTGFIDWILFWLKNWGEFLPLSIGGILVLWKTDRKVAYIASCWFGLFIISNLVQFQPQTWDNSKMLAWSYAGLSLPASIVLHTLYKTRNIVLAVVSICLFGVVVASGFHDVIHLLDIKNRSYRMLSNEQLELGKFVYEHTDPSDIFLTSDWVTNPVTIIGGRSIVLGYTGWIFNYGFEYGQREEDVRSMFSNPLDARDLFSTYTVTYVLVGPDEEKYTPNREMFDQQFVSVFVNSAGTIYKVQ